MAESLRAPQQRRRVPKGGKSFPSGQAPSTPGGQITSGIPVSPGIGDSVNTLFPQPRRAFQPPSAGTSPRSPGCGPSDERDGPCHGDDGLGDSKAFESNLAAGATIADRRPLSAVSTSAGATPSPDGRAGASPHPWPNTPESQRPSPHSPGISGGRGSTGSGRRNRGGGALYKAPQGSFSDAIGNSIVTAGGANVRQTGKVFVGGVPQDMTQDDLYNLLSEHGGVKKAWLQSYRTVGRMNQSPPHNHRGFGFVIFYEGSSVDKLLGGLPSKFIHTRDGRRMEIKRAMPSSELPGSAKPTPNGQTQVGNFVNSSQARSRGCVGSGNSIQNSSGTCMNVVNRTSETGITPSLPLASGHLPVTALQVSNAQLHGTPWTAANNDPRAQGAMTAWPTYVAPAASQAMTMPQSMHPQSMASAQSMMAVPMSYHGGYAGFTGMQAALSAGLPQQGMGQHPAIQQVQHGNAASYGRCQWPVMAAFQSSTTDGNVG